MTVPDVARPHRSIADGFRRSPAPIVLSVTVPDVARSHRSIRGGSRRSPAHRSIGGGSRCSPVSIVLSGTVPGVARLTALSGSGSRRSPAHRSIRERFQAYSPVPNRSIRGGSRRKSKWHDYDLHRSVGGSGISFRGPDRQRSYLSVGLRERRCAFIKSSQKLWGGLAYI